MIVWISLSSVILAKTTGNSGGFIFPGCLFYAPTYFFVAWIPVVVFESAIILITLYYLSAYHWTEDNNTILRVLARDSMCYFLVIFSVLISNLLIARFGHDFIGSLLIAPSSVIACVGAARMMMNIREISAGEDDPRASLEAGIEFGPLPATTVGEVEPATSNRGAYEP
ncbi:hypothetical protein B0H15DRAFT_862608 [Mycena belliarum]|uniref:Transmembrane protein n=1 Tax=Mycena belliarum TaxID=1033014 RepID=A0AAD6XKT6_9AGAR|nr:hypothetical protein B0H15DRAFT_862608 [Mycena belliae]